MATVPTIQGSAWNRRPVRAMRVARATLRRFAIVLAHVCWYAIASCTPAHAQLTGQTLADVADAESVGARWRGAYDPSGIAIGAFTLNSSIEARATYDSNVYNTDAVRRSDKIFNLAPHVDLQTRSPDFDLTLRGDANIQRFASLSAENNEQYDFSADSRISLSRAAGVSLSAFHGRHSELRGTLGDIVVGAPNQYVRTGGEAGAAVDVDGIVLSATGRVEKINYLAVKLGDDTFTQDYRDRTAYTGTLRASARIGPGMRAFVSGDYNKQQYRKDIGADGQDSHGYSVLGGIDFGLTELLSGEIGVGYLEQTYRTGAVRTVGGVTYHGRVMWNVTPLVTATLSGGRTLQQSPFFNQAGIVEDNVALHVDYELLRNLILSFTEAGTFDDYRGINRRDRLYTSDVSARYLLNRGMEAGLRFNHRHQSSSGTSARPYTGTSVTVSLILKR